jgi:hypothetical protein
MLSFSSTTLKNSTLNETKKIPARQEQERREKEQNTMKNSNKPPRTLAAARAKGQNLPAPKNKTVSAAALWSVFDRPIAFHPILAHISGSANAGIFLSQMLYWSKTKERTDASAEGWFYKSISEWTLETCLTEDEQFKVKCDLLERGLISIEQRGTRRHNYFKINKERLAAEISKRTDILPSAEKQGIEAPKNRPCRERKTGDALEQRLPLLTTQKEKDDFIVFQKEISEELLAELTEIFNAEVEPLIKLKAASDETKCAIWNKILMEAFKKNAPHR